MTEAFVEHRELMFSIVYNLLGSVTDTEDVLQETWLSWAGRNQDPRAPVFCEYVWLVTYCGMGWSRRELPGSCGYHGLMIAVEARACRAIIPDPSRSGPTRRRRPATPGRRAASARLPRYHPTPGGPAGRDDLAEVVATGWRAILPRHALALSGPGWL
jgi:hypothetical protein